MILLILLQSGVAFAADIEGGAASTGQVQGSTLNTAPLAGAAAQQLMMMQSGSAMVGGGVIGSEITLQMRQVDPMLAEAFQEALRQGDFATAQSIYNEFKAGHPETTTLDTSDMDPQLLQEINRAINKGDFKTARKLYAKYQNAKQLKSGKISFDQLRESEQSIFERTMSGTFPVDELKADLVQFGYDVFQKTAITAALPAATPVGPDYIVGPGDQLILTMWGTAEGIYTLKVTKEGEVTLPKVGVVAIAGTRFGDMEKKLRGHLSRYYSNFNLSVAIGKVKSLTIHVVGEVQNPGSFTLNALTSMYSALMTAGGPTKRGSLRNIQVLRGGKVIKTIDLYDFLLRGDRSQDMKLMHEDTIFVPLVGQLVGVSGSVYRQAIFEIKGGETIGDALQLAGGIMPIGVANQLQVIRYADNQRKVVIDLNLRGGTSPTPENAALKEKIRNMDVIRVQPLYDKVWETVSLQGNVRNPGDYQWRPDLKLREIIVKGQLLPTSDLRSVEIIRLTNDFMDRKIIAVDLNEVMSGDSAKDIALMPQDEIKVYTTYRTVEKVTLKGEVLRPGEYEVYKGEKLSDLFRRVGGFTREAYPYGTIFKRLDVKAAQNKNLKNFLSRMESQILQSAASTAATGVNPEDVSFAKGQMQINQSMLENLRKMQEQFEGRIAININENIDGWAGTKDDLLLQNGDSIVIPKWPQEVMVMGEVFSPGALVFVPGLQVKDYLNQTGGFTSYSAADQIFVVQANGFAFGSESPAIGSIAKVALNPGDTIIVPQKIERYAAMRFTKDIIDILFKTAVTAATLITIF